MAEEINEALTSKNRKHIQILANLIMEQALQDHDMEISHRGPAGFERFVSKWGLRRIGLVREMIDATYESIAFFNNFTQIGMIVVLPAIALTALYWLGKLLYYFVAHDASEITRLLNKNEKGEITTKDIHVKAAIEELNNNGQQAAWSARGIEFKLQHRFIYNAYRFITRRGIFWGLTYYVVPVIIHYFFGLSVPSAIILIVFLRTVSLNFFLQIFSQSKAIAHNVFIDQFKFKGFFDQRGKPTLNLRHIIDTRKDVHTWMADADIESAYKNGYLYVDSKDKALLRILQRKYGARTKSMTHMYLAAIPVYIINILIPFGLPWLFLRNSNSPKIRQAAQELKYLNISFYSGVLGLWFVNYEINWAVELGQHIGGPVQDLVDTIEGRPNGLLYAFPTMEANIRAEISVLQHDQDHGNQNSPADQTDVAPASTQLTGTVQQRVSSGTRYQAESGDRGNGLATDVTDQQGDRAGDQAPAKQTMFGVKLYDVVFRRQRRATTNADAGQSQARSAGASKPGIGSAALTILETVWNQMHASPLDEVMKEQLQLSKPELDRAYSIAKDVNNSSEDRIDAVIVLLLAHDTRGAEIAAKMTENNNPGPINFLKSITFADQLQIKMPGSGANPGTGFPTPMSPNSYDLFNVNNLLSGAMKNIYNIVKVKHNSTDDVRMAAAFVLRAYADKGLLTAKEKRKYAQTEQEYLGEYFTSRADPNPMVIKGKFFALEGLYNGMEHDAEERPYE